MITFRSLQARLATLYSITFGIALIGIAIAMQVAIAASAERMVRGELAASSTVIDRVWSMRSRELANAAAPLARDFGFRAAVASDDNETMRSALQNMVARLNVPDAFIVRYDGRVIGVDPAKDSPQAERLWNDLDSGWRSGALRHAGVTYQGVAAEITAPDLIGWLVVARRLDRKELEAVTSLSSIPLQAAIVRRDDQGHWRYDQTGRPVSQQSVDRLLNALSNGPKAKGSGITDSIDGEVIHARPLGLSDNQVRTALILEYSTSGALAQYDGLKLAVLLTGLMGLIVTMLASFRLARSLTRPIAALEDAARKLEHGERIDVAVTSDDEIGRLTHSFNRMSAEIVEREQRITHMAFHDALTGLPNRILFNEQLESALRKVAHGGELAVLCLDLDNFKIINDTLGHAVGDRLLQAVAERIRTHPAHSIARLGGDEFAILLTDDISTLRCEAAARDLIGAVSRPLDIDGHQIVVGASVGISLAPGDGLVAEDLLKHADLALYKSKEGGRGTFRFFETAMDEQAQARRAIELDMRGALANGEFLLYFQPLFDLASNRYSSFEALLRWDHPTRGIMQPAEFIPIAEETGLIVPIGEWVIQEACRQASSWPSEIGVAVNVSTVQFRSPGLNTVILQALAASNLAPERLEIEITESVFLDSADSILQLLHGLRSLGVRIALDDFGTGYSSLSYLRRFPFDKIKIDRSFIIELLEDKEASAVVHAITDLAAALGMETTAEGVEESGQLEALRAHGCTNVQGYLFSKPISADQVAALLTERNRAVA